MKPSFNGSVTAGMMAASVRWHVERDWSLIEALGGSASVVCAGFVALIGSSVVALVRNPDPDPKQPPGFEPVLRDPEH